MYKISSIIIRLVCTLVLLSTAKVVLAESYKVGIRTAKDGEYNYSYSAVFPKVFDAISEITDDSFEYINLPPSRVKKYFNEGKIDIEPGTNPIWRRNEKVPGLYSSPFSAGIIVLLFGPGKRQQFKLRSSRLPATIGTVRGYAYPPLQGQFNQGVLKRFDEVDETRLIKAIINGRLDQVLVSKQFASKWLSLNADPQAYEFGKAVERQPIMMRLHPNAASLMPRLNHAIELLIKNGRMKQLTGMSVNP